MQQSKDCLKVELGRPALIFAPSNTTESPDDPPSLFGSVTIREAGESWPEYLGQALRPLLQLNLSELPYRPKGLNDVAALALFVHPEQLANNSQNGTTWCLRTYSNLNKLVPLDNEAPTCSGMVIPLGPPELVEDYPGTCESQDSLPNHSGIKPGGWPKLTSSEDLWTPPERHPSHPEFVFQLGDLPDIGWEYGQPARCYIGRGQAPGHKKSWSLECLP